MKLPIFKTGRRFLLLALLAIVLTLYIYYKHDIKSISYYGINGNNRQSNFVNVTNSISKKLADAEIHQTIEKQMKTDVKTYCTFSDNLSDVLPLEDFRKYPCLNRLSVFPEEKWKTDGKCVRTFCYKEDRNLNTHLCVSLKTLSGKTPICIYPPLMDIFISASLQKTGQWESVLVNNLAQFLKDKPNTEFLDLGCNIGVYTLSLAHQGINVTAVDPLIENLELLSRSISLGKLQDRVTLIWNAIFDQHTRVKFSKGQRNVGGTHIVDSKLTSLNVRDYEASTITLDDLLPLFKGKRVAMKMDIEASEYNAFLGGDKFFQEVDVIVIQIEVLLTKKGNDGKNILSLMTAKGFEPYRDINKRSSLKLVSPKVWPDEVYFMKP